ISVESGLITATTAAHSSGLVDVVVTNPDSQSATASGAYAYQQPAPSISVVRPPSGSTSGGTALVITGSNFLPNPTVTVGGKAATNISVVNNHTITASTPPHASGRVNVTVTNPDGQFATLFGLISLLPNADFESSSLDWKFVGSGSAVVNDDPDNAEDGG